LFTTLPILWRESESIAGMLRADAPQSKQAPHWALRVLKARGRLYPLDSLSPMPQRLETLIMAQPRPLSGEENVALDDWVRGGGRLLLFADPLLTQDSEFGIGDRRRPQDVVLLSPILARWGLALAFDDAQPLGEWRIRLQGGEIVVNLPGRLSAAAADEAGFRCTISREGITADCRIGSGRAYVVADAALLESGAGENDRAAMLVQILSNLERKLP
jgi:hypothetical protein